MKYTAPIALAFLLTSCGNDPQEQWARAKASYDAHLYAKAKLDLVDLLEADANNWQARELLIRSYIDMGDGEAANAALVKLPPAHRPKDYALLAGETALLRERPDDALEAVKQIDSPSAQRIRALAFLAKDDSSAAATAFAAGLDSGHPTPRLLADYARFALQQGDVLKARSLVDEAMKGDSRSIDALLVDGQTATAQGNLARALDAYDKAIKAYPGNLAAITGKASVLGDLGRIDEMAKLVDAASASAGNDPSLTYLKARVAAARNDWKKTRDILQANEDDARGGDDVTILYAQALFKLGQTEQARARLQPVLTHAPGNAAARRLLAAVQLQQNDPAGAVKTLEPLAVKPTALAEDARLYAQAAKAAGLPGADDLARTARFPTPQSFAAALADADRALRAGNWANANALYKQIMASTDGKNPLVLNNLAFTEGQLGNNTAALKYALEALKYAPGNASVMDTAGWLLFETGQDRARAVKLLQQAAAKAPQNATIQKHLQAAQTAQR